jgi:hypothetical protein
VTEIVGVGQMRDIEFVAIPGDWALHCHKSHHTMNAMGHGIANPLGVDQRGVERTSARCCRATWPWARTAWREHQDHTDMGHMQGPENTLPMMMGKGPVREPRDGRHVHRAEGARRARAGRLPRSRTPTAIRRAPWRAASATTRISADRCAARDRAEETHARPATAR